jgi:hypothetical protein
VYSAWRGTERKKVHGDWSLEDFSKTVRLTNSRRLLLASFSGNVIAMNIFRFFLGGWFESAANRSLDEFMHLKLNDLMQWRGISGPAPGIAAAFVGGRARISVAVRRHGVPILRYRMDLFFSATI